MVQKQEDLIRNGAKTRSPQKRNKNNKSPNFVWGLNNKERCKNNKSPNFVWGLKGILSTSCVIFSYPKLLSISVLTFIK